MEWNLDAYLDALENAEQFEKFVTRNRQQAERKRMKATEQTVTKHEDSKRLARKVKQVYAEKAVYANS